MKKNEDDELAIYRLTYTLDNHRAPLIITSIGIALSIFCFALALNAQTNDIKEKFFSLAKQESALMDRKFISFHDKIITIQQLFGAHNFVDSKEINNLIEPTIKNGPFKTLNWQFKSKKQKTSPYMIQIKKGEDFFATKELKEAINSVTADSPISISMPFSFNNDKNEENNKHYIGITGPLLKNNLLQGSVTGIIDLNNLYPNRKTFDENASQVSVYLYFKNDGLVPLYKPKGNPHLPVTHSSSDAVSDLVKGSAFYYIHTLEDTNEEVPLIFVPTPAFLIKTFNMWPWYALAAALTITGLISTLVFQQTRRNVFIAQQVQKQTHQIRQVTRNLAEKESKLRAIFENAPDAIIITNSYGIIETINPVGIRMFGYKMPDVQNLNIKNLLVDSDCSIINTRSIQSQELVGIHRDGSNFPVEYSTSIFSLDNQNYFAAIVRDITQRKKTEDELRRYSEEVEQFAYIAAHDLKSPLRGIDNIAKWIEEDINEVTPEVKKHFSRLHECIARMERLLSDVLQYSKAGRLIGEMHEVNVSEIIQSIIKEQPTSFEIKYDNVISTLFAERTPLEQVFTNLIVNAVKHHDQGKGKIVIKSKDIGDFYEFSIEDDGPGIAPEHHERIFGLFQTLSTGKKAEGTGLGLPIVKKLIEWQGGKIWITSAPYRGTIMHFLWSKNHPTVS